MMRKLAVVGPRATSTRIVLYATDTGVFLFLRDGPNDGPCESEVWFEDVASAMSYAEDCGVHEKDWQDIPDPLPGCQHDWVAPVRGKTLADGTQVAGALEALDATGVWRNVQ
jgi:hypothetical protein